MGILEQLQRHGALKQRTNIKVAPHFSWTGGLNVMDDPMEIPPGQLLGCLNYEQGIKGGYRRFDGYERMDGHASPTDSSYTSVPLASATSSFPAVGVTLTESGSGATGVVAYVDTPNKVLVLVKVTGTFVGAGSTLTPGPYTTAPASNPPLVNNGNTTALADSYYYQKWLYLQSFIGPVGGAACSGPVRGVWPYKASVYAFRDNAAGTAGTMWVATSTGWQQVSLGFQVAYKTGVYFDGAMDPIPEGTVLTGQTSGATFTVLRVVTKTGTWGTDAAGYMITNVITGSPVANENLSVGTTTYATYVSTTAQTLPPGGLYHFRNFNFNAVQTPVNGFRMYGVNGVGQGFEYDDSGVFTFISTGMTTDVPTYLEVHASYLFFSFKGGSLQNSGYQQPLSWNPVTGADARQVGEDVTFLREDVNQTLVIGTRRQLWSLTGLQVEQFQVAVYSANTGAVAGTDENPGQMIFGEDRGITTVAAAAQYGNFDTGALTDDILTLITQTFKTDTVIGAWVTRKKNMYRLLFASGNVFCLAINAAGQFTGWTNGTYVHAPSCVSGGFTQTSAGPQIERSFFGSTNGYVYEIDKGRSFDGQSITHFLKLNYWHVNSPSVNKRFRYLQIDLVPEGSASVLVGCDCNYGNLTGMTSPSFYLGGNGGFWDIAIWDQFVWDNPTYTGIQWKLELEGYNISTVISGNAVNDASFTARGMLYQYSPRVINRNTGT